MRLTDMLKIAGLREGRYLSMTRREQYAPFLRVIQHRDIPAALAVASRPTYCIWDALALRVAAHLIEVRGVDGDSACSIGLSLAIRAFGGFDGKGNKVHPLPFGPEYPDEFKLNAEVFGGVTGDPVMGGNMCFVGSLRSVAEDMLEAQRVLQSSIDSAVLVNLSHLARSIERMARQLGIDPVWFPSEG